MALVFSPLVQAGDRKNPLVIGVHPYLPHVAVKKRFQKLADYLEEKTGQPVTVKVGRDYGDHIRAVGLNQLDVAYLGPVSYVEMTGNFGAKPVIGCLERSGKSQLRGVIVVHANSDVRQLSQLRGKVFAFGDPYSTMSTRVPQAYLAGKGINTSDLGSFNHYKGHTNVALAVLTGQADAGAVKQEVFERFADQGLRKLADLPAVAEHLFVTRSDMSVAQQNQLTALLRNANEDPEGRAALKGIHNKVTGIRAVTDSDYNNLRHMLENASGHGQ